MGGGTGRRRIVIGGLALLGLLAAVGLASRAHTPTGGGGTRPLDSDILLEYLLVLIAAAGVVVVPVALWAFVFGRREEYIAALPARRNWMASLLVTMTIFAVLSILVLGGRLFRHHQHTGSAPLNPLATLTNKGSRASRAVRFDWMPVIVVGSLTVAGLTALAVIAVRRREPARPRRAVEALVLALERTVEDLRAESDPRRAVIAAYAQMEAALGRAGLPRAPSEAPREYLERVLPAVGAGGESVERLTGLFERAKFSPHAIDAAMKEEAISALESLRDELRGAG
jgi:Domain of unknown function (DUF4129)